MYMVLANPNYTYWIFCICCLPDKGQTKAKIKAIYMEAAACFKLVEDSTRGG